MSKRTNSLYRSNPTVLTAAIIGRNYSLKKVAGKLGMKRNAIEQLMRVPTPLTFRNACRLRNMFGRGAVIDETGIL